MKAWLGSRYQCSYGYTAITAAVIVTITEWHDSAVIQMPQPTKTHIYRLSWASMKARMGYGH